MTTIYLDAMWLGYDSLSCVLATFLFGLVIISLSLAGYSKIFYFVLLLCIIVKNKLI